MKCIDGIMEATATNESWAKELGITITVPQQRELDRMPDTGRFFIRMERGEGKTFLTAFIASRWALTHPYGLVAILCPTMNQAKHIWIPQFQRIVNRSMRASHIFTFTRDGFVVGDTPNYQWGGHVFNGQDPLSIQGVCRKHIFTILDESRGVLQNTKETAAAVTLNATGLFLET